MVSIRPMSSPAVHSPWAVHTCIIIIIHYCTCMIIDTIHICKLFLMNNFGENCYEFLITIDRLKETCFQQDRPLIIPGCFDTSWLCRLLFPCLSFLEPRCIRKLTQWREGLLTFARDFSARLYCNQRVSQWWGTGATCSGDVKICQVTYADVSLDKLTSQEIMVVENLANKWSMNWQNNAKYVFVIRHNMTLYVTTIYNTT